MIKRIALLFILTFTISLSHAQSEFSNMFETKLTSPFLFSETLLTPQDNHWNLNYSGSFGHNNANSFGYEGVTQQISVKGYLGSKFTLVANNSFGFANSQNNLVSAQQVEVMRSILGGNKPTGLNIGLSLGANRDYDNVFALQSRIILFYTESKFKIGGNLLFEKAFAENRDEIDLLSSIGFHYQIFKNFFAGIEAVGEDLEGIWDDEEAEGGAKIYVGPNIYFLPEKSNFSFTLSGGPVIYATENCPTSYGAIRDIPSQQGLLIRGKITYSL